MARVVLQARRVVAAAVHQAHPRPRAGLGMSAGAGRGGVQRGVPLRERGARADHVDGAAAPLHRRTAALQTKE